MNTRGQKCVDENSSRQGLQGVLRAPEGAGKWELIMSMRIAVALAATIVASAVMSSGAQARPELVGINGEYAPGTIVVKTHERRLYLILNSGPPMRYPVGVGKAGKQWEGTTKIDGKYLHPAWSPPSEVRRDKPGMPDVIPGGSPRNPMGVAAMHSPAANTRSMALTCQTRSAVLSPMAASGCTTTTLPISFNAYRSERR